jgi:hypothetical protein
MIADDYCMTSSLETVGGLGLLRWYYFGWSGQFTYPLIKSLTYYTMGMNAYVIMPALIYLFWWAGNTLVMRILTKQCGWQVPTWFVFCLSTIHMFVLLSTMASRQTMYWLDALLFHVLPLSIFSWIVASWLLATVSPTKLRSRVVIFSFVSFLYAGTHILTSLFGLAFWFLAVVLIYLYMPSPRRHTALPITIATFLGNLIGLLIVLLAPGNLQRFEVASDIVGSVITIPEALFIALDSAITHWISPLSLIHIFAMVMIMVALSSIGTMLGYIPQDNNVIKAIQKHTWLLIGVSLLLAVLYSSVSLLLPILSFGRANTRVYVTSGLVKTWVSLWIGFLLATRLIWVPKFARIRFAWIIMAICLVAAMGMYRIYDNALLMPEYQKWAQEWDVRHQALLEAKSDGALSVAIAPFTTTLPKFLGPDTDSALADWSRSCMQDYYHIPSISLDNNLGDEIIRILEVK